MTIPEIKVKFLPSVVELGFLWKLTRVSSTGSISKDLHCFLALGFNSHGGEYNLSDMKYKL